MIVGCYSLDLYCGHQHNGEYKCTAWPGQFTGRTAAASLRAAKRAGWKVDKRNPDGVLCPKHRAVENHLAGSTGK